MTKNNVLIGKEGWLFLHGGNQNQFNYLRNIEKISQKSIDNFCENIDSRIEYFKNLNIVYKYVVFPSKPLLKQDYLPNDYSNVSSLFLNYYQKALGKHENYVFYPLQILKDMEQSHSTFLKSGTHNTDYGYFKIVNSLLLNLGLDLISEDFYLKKINTFVYSDLAEMISSEENYIEEVINIQNVRNYQIGNKEFLPSNTNDVYILHNSDAITKKRVLIFGDSFFKDTLKYLSICFNDILYIRSTFIHKDIIENFQPDIVLSGTAERYLSHVENDNNSNNFLLELYGKKEFQPSEEYTQALVAYMSFKNYKHIYNNWLKNIKIDNKINEITIRREYDIIKNFNINWNDYYKQNHIIDGEIDPIFHYILNWRNKNLIINNMFSTNDYLNKYLDIKKADINPLIHYFLHGIKEGRNCEKQ